MPSIYVFDCSNSGLILDKFTEFQQQRDGKIDNMNGTVSDLAYLIMLFILLETDPSVH